MKLLPIGITDFGTIRGFKDRKKSEQDYIYADKTELLYNLLEIKYPYFLSRPRRFGKSLLVDTL
ncbi:MAG: AAA family ATPase, partial [Deltaproteobacteria bacterium]|nr:AAA family ATPase [Deltaproteobacteria bacterium]